MLTNLAFASRHLGPPMPRPACKLVLALCFLSCYVLQFSSAPPVGIAKILPALGSGKVLLSSLGILQSEVVWQASDTQ